MILQWLCNFAYRQRKTCIFALLFFSLFVVVQLLLFSSLVSDKEIVFSSYSTSKKFFSQNGIKFGNEKYSSRKNIRSSTDNLSMQNVSLPKGILKSELSNYTPDSTGMFKCLHSEVIFQDVISNGVFYFHDVFRIIRVLSFCKMST